MIYILPYEKKARKQESKKANPLKVQRVKDQNSSVNFDTIDFRIYKKTYSSLFFPIFHEISHPKDTQCAHSTRMI